MANRPAERDDEPRVLQWGVNPEQSEGFYAPTYFQSPRFNVAAATSPLEYCCLTMPPRTFSKYYVYILYSQKDKGLYIGFTDDLRARVARHNSGSVSSTKERAPFTLLHYEYFLSEKDARSREVFLKSGYGRRHLKTLLHHTLTLSD